MTTIYTQPSASGIAGATYINGKGESKPGQWALTFWVDRPIVATDWDASLYTGLSVPSPVSEYTAGYSKAQLSTVGQMVGTSSGLFVNSVDDSVGVQAIATAGVYFDGAPRLFETYKVVTVSYDLEVASVHGDAPGQCYVLTKFSLTDRVSGQRLLYEVTPFNDAVDLSKQRSRTGVEGGGGYWVRSPLLPGQLYITVPSGVTLEQTDTWVGPLPFAYSISSAQLASALAVLAGKGYSQDPANYEFNGFHAHFQASGGSSSGTYIGGNIGSVVISAA